MRRLQARKRQTIVLGMIQLRVICVLAVLSVSGCGTLAKLTGPRVPDQTAAPAAPQVGVSVLGTGQSAAVLDASTAAERTAALATPVAKDRGLGTVLVALGSPAEQGFWLKSTLVVVAGKGRVQAEDGTSVAVDLLPSTGGALLSLAAFRALGFAMTDLPEVSVFVQ